MVSFRPLEVYASFSRKPRVRSGSIIPLWKHYDESGLEARMVYAATCLPGNVKGPYRHTRRRGLLSVLKGKVAFVYRENGRFRDKVLSAGKQPVLVDIPPMQDYAIVGLGREESILVNVCDYAWREGDGETLTPDFSGYDFGKWRGK